METVKVTVKVWNANNANNLLSIRILISYTIVYIIITVYLLQENFLKGRSK